MEHCLLWQMMTLHAVKHRMCNSAQSQRACGLLSLTYWTPGRVRMLQNYPDNYVCELSSPLRIVDHNFVSVSYALIRATYFP
jgi:hypothetical protein